MERGEEQWSETGRKQVAEDFGIVFGKERFILVIGTHESKIWQWLSRERGEVVVRGILEVQDGRNCASD